MGIIQRQSIKNSLVNYLGVAIGAVSVIFIYPRIGLSDLGTVQFALSMAVLFAPFASFASSMAALKYYPIFKDEDKSDNGFIFILSLSTLIASLIFTVLIYGFRMPISKIFSPKDATIFLNTLHFILIFTVILSLTNLFISLASNYNRIVVPSILQNLLPKITQPILILLFASGAISFVTIFKGMTLTLVLGLGGLVLYIFFLKGSSFFLRKKSGIFTKKIGWEMLSFSAFNLFVVLGSILSQRVDQLMIASKIGYEALAVFGFGFFVSEAIDVPRKAISSIITPILSGSIYSNDMPQVLEVYRKSALLQLIIGTFLLAGIWACVDSLFDLMPKNGDAFRAGKYVILILGFSKIADMVTGLNGEIITLSPFFRFNLTSFVTMAVLNAGLNLLLIPKFGIQGSAAATFISTAGINLWRLFYIQHKMGIQPLQNKMITVALFGIISWFCASLLPAQNPPFLNLFLKGGIVSLVFIPAMLFFNVSEEINQIFYDFLKKLKISKN